MTRLNQSTRNAYPALAGIVDTWLPSFLTSARSQNLRSKFRTFVELPESPANQKRRSDALMTRAFSANSGPRIKPAILPKKTRALVEASKPNRISVNSRLLQAFENIQDHPASVTFMQGIILHELVHWARLHNPDPDKQNLRKEEFGVYMENCFHKRPLKGDAPPMPQQLRIAYEARFRGEALHEKRVPPSGRLSIVVGHTASRQGAVSVAPLNQTEFEYNSELAELMQKFGELRGHKVDIVFRPQPGKQGIKLAYEEVSSYEPDAVIELHFNAFNGQVRGTETLYSDLEDTPGVFEVEFANIIQNRMVKVFNRKGRSNRGIKSRPRTTRERGWYNVNQTTDFPSILIEPFFGDNEQDAKLALTKQQALAEELIKGFDKWLVTIGKRNGLI